MSQPGNSDTSTPPGSGHFVTTHWSAVLQAGRADSPPAEAALAELCQSYWYPLYAYLRRLGRSPEDAEDLTQEFFARLLAKNYLAEVDREKGRFRSFLLVALKRFLANEWDRVRAKKRGGGQATLSLDQALAESRYHLEPAHHVTPEVLFDRQWARTLLDQVLARLQQEHAETGRTELFERLRGCLSRESGDVPYAALGAPLRLTEAAVKMAVQRLRRRYRELLRQEIRRTVERPEEVEDELRHLFATFND